MIEDGLFQMLTEAECRALIPSVAPDANKYTRGTLAIIGGSADYPAAPVMAARAAMRTGAGYVRLFAPEQAAHIARMHLLSVPVVSGAQAACGSFDPECASELVRQAGKMSAFVIGPGMGASKAAGEFLARLLKTLTCKGDARPLLFDADALNAIAKQPELMELCEDERSVLTPHEGEAARLLGRDVSDRLADVRELAQRYRSVVVLKGPRTLIASPEGAVRVCEKAGPELAKAGTGDVLSGIIGALIAQGLAPFEASCLGVFLHSRAGRLAAAEMSINAVMAEDIIEFIGPAYISMGA